jgi:flagellar hook-associated protein 1 FlgK
MSLSVALEQARSALTQQAARASVASSNILNAQLPGYHRRTQQVISSDKGSLEYVTVRETNAALERELLKASGISGKNKAEAEVLQQLPALLTDYAGSGSLPARLSLLNSSLVQFAGDPSNEALGRAVIAAATDAAAAIRMGADQITAARKSINERITQSATDIRAFLEELSETEAQMQRVSSSGGDINDIADQRDRIVAGLAEVVSIRVVDRPDNTMAIYTDSGLVVYDRVPRDVGVATRFDPYSGGDVIDLTIDGMNATAPNSIMPVNSAMVGGLAQTRERILGPSAVQLDEMARALADAFSDVDSKTPAALPKVQGLFVIKGSNGEIPAAYTAGLSSRLDVSALADGNFEIVALLRDGGIGAPAIADYNHNQSGVPGFQERLNAIRAALDAPTAFDTRGRVSNAANLGAYATSMSAWINELLQNNQSNREAADTSKAYLQKQLANELGVNLDDEMARMLDIQHSYQVAAKLISSLDEMFVDLLNRIN